MNRVARLSALIVVILGVGSAIGWGATRIVADPAGVIHGCYLLHGRDAGLVRLLPAADPCRKGERAISWSQTGPQGPAGAQGVAGPQGLAGPQGATGPSAAANVTVVTGVVEADCPTGQVAVGGGGLRTGSPPTYIYETYPAMTGTVPTGWIANAPSVYAICIKP